VPLCALPSLVLYVTTIGALVGPDRITVIVTAPALVYVLALVAAKATVGATCPNAGPDSAMLSALRAHSTLCGANSTLCAANCRSGFFKMNPINDEPGDGLRGDTLALPRRHSKLS
jgi:hypothetical protein